MTAPDDRGPNQTTGGDDSGIGTAGAPPSRPRARYRAGDAEKMVGVIIRPLVDGDLDAAADVYLAARHASVPSMPPLVHTDDVVRWWVRQTWPGRTWVATVEGEVAGVLVLDGAQIDHLFVAPTRTGRGLGGLLLDRAKVERPEGLWLWVFATNIGARRLYLRHGFTEAELTDGTENEEHSPAVRSTWSPPSG